MTTVASKAPSTRRPRRTAATTAKPTTTNRVSIEVRDRLQARADAESITVGHVVSALLEADEENRYWEEMRQAVERTRADPEAWAEYKAESDLWEHASLEDFQMYVRKHDL